MNAPIVYGIRLQKKTSASVEQSRECEGEEATIYKCSTCSTADYCGSIETFHGHESRLRFHQLR